MKFSFLTHLVHDFKASHIIGNFLKFKVISKQFAILPHSLVYEYITMLGKSSFKCANELPDCNYEALKA